MPRVAIFQFRERLQLTSNGDASIPFGSAIRILDLRLSDLIVRQRGLSGDVAYDHVMSSNNVSRSTYPFAG
ncbi:hypothetical protein WK53_17120 [Burkholderia ubonensis]|uniref:Uncharacterized protein n=1 Tax=Burkholderia ubonensis TaxID=101571 RepID=A0AAW3N225_9BURK|nr:hypothetical protein WK53_17120 [Burkholderia ubonensis]